MDDNGMPTRIDWKNFAQFVWVMWRTHRRAIKLNAPTTYTILVPIGNKYVKKEK